MMQSRFLAQIKSYKKTKAELDELVERFNENEEPGMAEQIERLKAKERLLRGVVRGAAQMLIIISNPAEAKDNDAINDLEIDSGMPGKRSRPKPGVSPTITNFLDRYNGRI